MVSMEERAYTINIRRGTLTSPKWEKSNDSVVFVKKFLERHMKTKDVKIDNSISEKIWEHGSKYPAGKIKVKVRKDDDGVATAYLWGKEPLILEEPKKKGKETKVEEPKEEVKEGSVAEETNEKIKT